MSSDGSDQRRVVDAATVGGAARRPTLSPDGTMIAFLVQTGGRSRYYLIRADGSHPDTPGIAGIKLMADYAGTGRRGVCWHPDGSRLVVSGGPAVATPNGREAGSDLFEVYLDGSAPVNLTQNPATADVEPDIRFQGDRIAWNQGPDLMIAPLGGGSLAPTRHATGARESPIWSPTGDRLVVQGYPGGEREIYLRNEDGSYIQQLTTDGPDNDQSDWALVEQ